MRVLDEVLVRTVLAADRGSVGARAVDMLSSVMQPRLLLFLSCAAIVLPCSFAASMFCFDWLGGTVCTGWFSP